MNKGLGLFALSLLLLATSAHAATTTGFYLSGASGNPMLDGKTFTYVHQDGDNNFEVDTLDIDFGMANEGLGSYSLGFKPPQGQTLAVGMYSGIQPGFLSSPVRPVASVSTNWGNCTAFPNPCAITGGWFLVRDIQKTGDTVTSIAIDFYLTMQGSSVPLTGSVRYNSGIPFTQDAPTAHAGMQQIVHAGDTVHLDGSQSLPGNGSITGYAWTQLSGPAVTFSDAGSAVPSFTAPAVDPGGADVVLQLEVDNSLGDSGTDTVTIHVLNAADPFTYVEIEMTGNPTDELIPGSAGVLDAKFTAQPENIGLGNKVSLSVDGDSDHDWLLEFGPAEGQTLQVGDYVEVDGVPGPRMTAFCAVSTAHFVIRDMQVSGTTLVSFAVDFVERCAQGGGEVRGHLRYNSSVPVEEPLADVGDQVQAAIQGDIVVLSGTLTDPGDGATIVSYQWTQVSGPAVTLSGADTASPSFTAPPVDAGGEPLVFQLTVTNSAGLSSTETITVQVAAAADPVTGLYLQGITDFDQPIQQLLLPIDGSFSIDTDPTSHAVTVGYQDALGPWVAILAPPTGQQLHVGVYSGAVLAGTQTAKLAGIDVEFGRTGNCFGAGGQFDILQIAYDDAGNVTQLAADFVFQCNGEVEELRGKVRYDSSVTLRSPTADAGHSQQSYPELPVTLDGSASTAGFGSISSYAWTQLRGAGDPVVVLSGTADAKPLFFAPEVPAGGLTLKFQLTVTNSLGLSSTDVASVTVGGTDDIKTAFYYESDPDDPAGNGGHGLVVQSDDNFSATLGVNALGATLSTGNPSDPPFDWELGFGTSFPPGLTPGIYVTDPVTGFPNMNVIAGTSGTCDSPQGIFIVRDITHDIIGRVFGFGIDFMQRCAGATGTLRGALRFRSTTPVLIDAPTAYAGGDQQLSHAGSVTLDGSNSFPGWGDIQSYHWQQQGGPRIQLTDANQAVAHLNLPASLFAGDGTTLKFILTVKNSLGLSSSSTVSVTAHTPDSNSLVLTSDPGDPVGQGMNESFMPSNDKISATTGAGELVRVQVPPLDLLHWQLQFAAPGKQKLKVGTYPHAQLPPAMGTSLLPGLSVSLLAIPGVTISPAPTHCSSVKGDFNVLDVKYKGKTLTSLAVDFDQYCDGASAGLHGKLRYHSTVP